MLFRSEQFLNQKTKVELTDIYMEKFQVLLKTLPYTSFTLRMDSIVVDTLNQKIKLDIPNNKYTKSKREKVSKEADEYNKVIKEQLLEIVPYSDKNEIIRGILFLQKMTEKLNNNF